MTTDHPGGLEAKPREHGAHLNEHGTASSKARLGHQRREIDEHGDLADAAAALRVGALPIRSTSVRGRCRSLLHYHLLEDDAAARTDSRAAIHLDLTSVISRLSPQVS